MESPPRLATILTLLGLTGYASRFARHDVTDSLLAELTDADLAEIGVVSAYDRQRILHAIDPSRPRPAPVPADTTAASPSPAPREGALQTASQPARASRESAPLNGPGALSPEAGASFESSVARLREAKALLGDGTLSAEEFVALKAQILGAGGGGLDSGARSGAAGGSVKGLRRSRVAAILLSFFLGEFGVDRFYTGHPGAGTVKLLLFLGAIFSIVGAAAIAGASRNAFDGVVGCASISGLLWIGLGVWWLVDFILYASGAIDKTADGTPIHWE